MSEYMKTQTSFSGADLVVAFGKRVIGELQSISWAIQRKKAPVYTLGQADARSFARGIRGIAGSFVFAVFDRDALLEEMGNMWNEIAPKAMYTAAGNLVLRNNENFTKALDLAAWNSISSGLEADVTGELTGQLPGMATDADSIIAYQNATNGSTEQVPVPPGFAALEHQNILYADMLPPFDITMTFANEYGQAAFQKIYDVDILNEVSGVSVDSIVMERQMTYIARRISPLARGIYDRNQDGTISIVNTAANS